ncbi:LOW QUALITY PROTEIN: zinc finger protein 516 [Callorhinchus milii]|uniref:LOW QUALITY PROTEIN: zinc finger protein 516 n=1 Tax=Callorhinchus milii TaxID=7868 RepID=UPI001C3FB59D|nr:LOW QUALITY PROTEIN: zinc finger protein 516 [Callorhinchus milii]
MEAEKLDANLDGNDRDERKSPKFICQTCERSFPFLSVLSVHMRTHTGEKPFKCPYCDHRTSQKGNLKIHIRTHKMGDLSEGHENDMGDQQLKEVSASEKLNAYTNPMKSRSSSNKVQNGVTKIDNGKIILRRLKKEKETLSANGSETFQCSFCKGKFGKKHELEQHVQLLHKSYKCRLCKYITLREDKLLSHIEKIHITVETAKSEAESRKSEQTVNEYTCEICRQTFSQSWFLKAHMKKHNGSFGHGCHVCGRRFKESWFLKNHMKVHGTKSASKNKVSKSDVENTATINDVVQEDTIGHAFSQYKICMKCGYLFPNKESLREHDKLHYRTTEASLGGKLKSKRETSITRGTETATTKEYFLRCLNLRPSVTLDNFTSRLSAKGIAELDPVSSHQAWHLATKGKVAEVTEYARHSGLNGVLQVSDITYNKEEGEYIVISAEKRKRDQDAHRTGYPKKRSRTGNLCDKDSSLPNRGSSVDAKNSTDFRPPSRQSRRSSQNKSTECFECGKVFRTYHQVVLHSRVHRKNRKSTCKREQASQGGRRGSTSEVDSSSTSRPSTPSSASVPEDVVIPKLGEEGIVCSKDGPHIASDGRAQIILEECSQTLLEKGAETLSEEGAQIPSEESTQTLSEERTQTLLEERTQTLSEERAQTLSEERTQVLSEKEAQALSEESAQTLSEESIQTLSEERTQTRSEKEAQALSKECKEILSEERTQGPSEVCTQIPEEGAQTLSEEGAQTLSEEGVQTLSEESTQKLSQKLSQTPSEEREQILSKEGTHILSEGRLRIVLEEDVRLPLPCLGEKPYKCFHCDYAATKLILLQCHMDQHNMVPRVESNEDITDTSNSTQAALSRTVGTGASSPSGDATYYLDVKRSDITSEEYRCKAQIDVPVKRQKKERSGSYEILENAIHSSIPTTCQKMSDSGIISTSSESAQLDSSDESTSSGELLSQDIGKGQAIDVQGQVAQDRLPLDLTSALLKKSTCNSNLALKDSSTSLPQSSVVTHLCQFCDHTTLYPEVLSMHQRVVHKLNLDAVVPKWLPRNGFKDRQQDMLHGAGGRRTGPPPVLEGKDSSPLPTARAMRTHAPCQNKSPIPIANVLPSRKRPTPVHRGVYPQPERMGSVGLGLDTCWQQNLNSCNQYDFASERQKVRSKPEVQQKTSLVGNLENHLLPAQAAILRPGMPSETTGIYQEAFFPQEGVGYTLPGSPFQSDSSKIKVSQKPECRVISTGEQYANIKTLLCFSDPPARGLHELTSSRNCDLGGRVNVLMWQRCPSSVGVSAPLRTAINRESPSEPDQASKHMDVYNIFQTYSPQDLSALYQSWGANSCFSDPTGMTFCAQTRHGEYICRECGKCFSQPSHLRTHMRSHTVQNSYCSPQMVTGERPFQCRYCPYSASQKGNLKTHVQCVHRVPFDNNQYPDRRFRLSRHDDLHKAMEGHFEHFTSDHQDSEATTLE